MTEKNKKKIEDFVDDSQDVVTIKEKNILAKVGEYFIETIKVIILAGITISVVRYFLFKPFYVKGQSMEPNYYEKDYLIIDELSYRFREPQRGEVVVFRAPSGNDYYLKRILGLPGERIKVEEGKVVVYNDDYPQGVVVEELYLEEDTQGSVLLTLGDKQYFVMGDNRDSSYDSRRFGPIDKEDIVGRTFLRGWPFTRITKFDSPSYNL